MAGCSAQGNYSYKESVALISAGPGQSFAVISVQHPKESSCDKLDLHVGTGQVNLELINLDGTAGLKEEEILAGLISSAEAVSRAHAVWYPLEDISCTCRRVEEYQRGWVNRCLTESDADSLRWICHNGRCSIDYK